MKISSMLILCVLLVDLDLPLLLEGYFTTMSIEGRVHPNYTLSSSYSINRLDCHKDLCKRRRNCAVSYSTITQECLLLSLPTQILMFDQIRKQLIYMPKDLLWKTVMTKPRYLFRKSPAVFWMFDDIVKGKNFGFKGKQLDYPPIGMAWNDVGPQKAESPLRYPRGSPFDMRSFVSVVKGDERLINLENGFTLSMWIKINNKKSARMIVDNANWFEYYKGFDFWLLQSDGSNKFATDLSGIESEFDYVSKAFKDDLTKWNHVALVYEKTGEIEFYINGKQIGLSVSNKQAKLIQNKRVVLWTTGNKNHSFDGSMAHVSIHEKAFNPRQVRVVMENFL